MQPTDLYVLGRPQVALLDLLVDLAVRPPLVAVVVNGKVVDLVAAPLPLNITYKLPAPRANHDPGLALQAPHHVLKEVARG